MKYVTDVLQYLHALEHGLAVRATKTLQVGQKEGS
jgi:hypothetical protein